MIAQESIDSKPRIPPIDPPPSSSTEQPTELSSSSIPSQPDPQTGPSFDAMETEDTKPIISSLEVDSINFQLAQLREQARVQSLSIQKLISENKTQAAQILRLSKENRFQEETIGKLSRKVIPKGHWVQGVQETGGGKDGKGKGKVASTSTAWEWSLVSQNFFFHCSSTCDTAEKGEADSPLFWWSLQDRYADPSLVARTRPYSSLLDLSTSLVQLVFSYLGTNELAIISRVSFRLLEVASPLMYQDVTVSFARARKLFCLRVRSTRLFLLLLPPRTLPQADASFIPSSI